MNGSGRQEQCERGRGRHDVIRALAPPALATALATCAPEGSTLAWRGVTGTDESALGWTLIGVSGVVVLVISTLVLVAALRARRKPPLPPRGLLAAGGGGLSWIVIGALMVPAVVLAGLYVFTILVMAATAVPGRTFGANVAVIGHQWWWEFQFSGNRPDERAGTANEIHIPVGEPVRLQLTTADVIHSFWVPRLAGKTDMIPGQQNVMWLEAKEPGAYWGRCGEYCGAQHAHMMLWIFAEPRQKYEQWLAGQRAPAPAPGTAAEEAGLKIFLGIGCSNCHTIRGTPAGGAIGPDLTHLMTRTTIAAGTLPNTRGNLAGWIADAQGLKPGVRMPTMAVKPQQLKLLMAYLETLR